MKMRIALLAIGIAALAGAQAATYEGVTVPDTVTVGGKSLVLNGMGLRTKFFFRIYVGALYLPQKAASMNAVLDQTGPDRILMHMIYAVDKSQFVDAWSEGFKDNNPQMSAGLKADVDKFIVFFGNSKKNDVITLDYLPGQGTQVSWNGAVKGTIPGEDFHQALLRVFIGPKPPTEALKKGLLGAHR